jgi:hypothetical protein
MAQGTATQHRLVACELPPKPERASLVERKVVEFPSAYRADCRRSSTQRKDDSRLASCHRMDRPARIVARKEQDMKQDYEGQGLERFARTVFALAGVGVVALVGGAVWGVWKWLT